MKEIPLTQGQVALVDDEDYEELSKYKWQVRATRRAGVFYAVRTVTRKGRSAQSIYMHRQIMGATKGQDVDHRNGNGLDNRRENMRLCSRAQNIQNKRKIVACSSQYKGVSFYRRRRCWEAYINRPNESGNGKRERLGYFKAELDAAKAYNSAAREMFGEFALLNDIEETQ